MTPPRHFFFPFLSPRPAEWYELDDHRALFLFSPFFFPSPSVPLPFQVRRADGKKSTALRRMLPNLWILPFFFPFFPFFFHRPSPRAGEEIKITKKDSSLFFFFFFPLSPKEVWGKENTEVYSVSVLFLFFPFPLSPFPDFLLTEPAIGYR